jgi:hypothetical protein
VGNKVKDMPLYAAKAVDGVDDTGKHGNADGSLMDQSWLGDWLRSLWSDRLYPVVLHRFGYWSFCA